LQKYEKKGLYKKFFFFFTAKDAMKHFANFALNFANLAVRSFTARNAKFFAKDAMKYFVNINLVQKKNCRL